MRHSAAANQRAPLSLRRTSCGAIKAAVKPLRSKRSSSSWNILILTDGIMTFEEVLIQKPAERAQCAGAALEEVLVSAKDNQSLTVGVYECAKVMNLDPDSVSFCVLATDEQFEWDVALQIHFTLIQSFCFDNDISIVRVSDTQRLAAIVGDEQEDAHCVLITNPADGSWEDPALEKLHLFCKESRRLNDWVPEISLPER
ncbi:LOW QUALITY PROTEIN: growth arrest and DNA damage-inducible protein GADD45 gamma-like [Xiphophorus hellerii]|uniref:LOW QUALITY PROTEIN: growth arrest and DNA damage-inducible protein GADD45 gamma-like n=1 Tax=Xiphophorus hellerii TaxID=8084 RepID=UPI0013B4519C|nr:LOW QUALITY PROTEIN: growth arrest and DNA damage-inducible protein GADD45 gamma-like [Xiphophorus hellerii]